MFRIPYVWISFGVMDGDTVAFVSDIDMIFNYGFGPAVFLYVDTRTITLVGNETLPSIEYRSTITL